MDNSCQQLLFDLGPGATAAMKRPRRVLAAGPRLAPQAAEVLALAGSYPEATPGEMARRCRDLNRQQIANRLKELAERGLAASDKWRICKVSGRRAWIWKLTAAGWRELEKARRAGRRRGGLTGQEIKVMDLVCRFPGMSGAELSERTNKLDRYQVQRVLPVLRAAGLVGNGPARVCKITKKECLSWRATAAGERLWRAAKERMAI